MPARRRAFTLVELLVVLGIISVLIALLMPALVKVRRQSLELKCSANLRSIGQAMAMYTQQYGHYPGSMYGVFGSAVGLWPVRLRPFLNADQRAFDCPMQDERCAWGPGRRPHSRAAKLDASYGYEPGEALLEGPGQYFSYGYNYTGTGGLPPVSRSEDVGLGYELGGYYIGTQVPIREIPVSRVKVPAEMIAITDSDANGTFDFLIDPHDYAKLFIWPGRVHREGANVLFCDWHVAWYAQKDLTNISNEDPAGQRMHRMWNNDHSLYAY